jgi:integrase
MAIYKRGENWYADFFFHGERIRRMIGPKRKGAEKVIAKWKAEVAENKFLDKQKEPDPIKFREFAKEYLQWAKANKKPSSYDRELSTMRRLSNEFENHIIQNITTWQIEKWKARRKVEIRRPNAVIGSFMKKEKDGTQREIWYVEYDCPRQGRVKRIVANKKEAELYLEKIGAPVKPATVNRELSLLKHMFTKAIEWSKVKENPAKKVKLLKGEVKRVRFLMPDEIRDLLSNCADHLKPIVTVALHTGMRKGELLGLKWEQVNFDQGIITLTDTKNNERRDLPMNETVKAMLQATERKGDYVFCNGEGETFANVRRSFETAVRKSKIEDFRFHDLRHTFASNLVMEGVDIMTVKELMGHKDLTMTLRYSHLAPNYKTKAVNILDRVMSLISPHAETSKKVVSLSIGNH